MGNNRTINILHLYPKILATYGDSGNMESLLYQINKLGYKANLYTSEIGEEVANPDEIDIIFIGGGQDTAQLAASGDIARHREMILAHYNNNRVILAICGGYQLLGEYFITYKGERIEGLGIVPIKTVGGDYRAIGYSAVQLNPAHFGEIGKNNVIVGFENHSGMTITEGVGPMGKIVNGAKGNNGDGYEGIASKNLYGTYLHGPLLGLNPHFRDFLIQKAIFNRYGESIEKMPENKFEEFAYDEALSVI